MRILAIQCDAANLQTLKSLQIHNGERLISPTVFPVDQLTELDASIRLDTNDILAVQANQDVLKQLPAIIKQMSIRPSILGIRTRGAQGESEFEWWDVQSGRTINSLRQSQLEGLLGLVSERQRMETQVDQARAEMVTQEQKITKLRESAFRCFDQLAHDFRSPLTVIREYTELMREGMAGPTSDIHHDYLRVIQDRSEELGHVVDDMLDIRKSQMGLLTFRRQAAELTPRVATVISRLQRRAASKGVSLKMNAQGCLPAAFCDIDKVQRAIFNLVLNAVKYADEGDHVSVEMRASSQRDEIIVEIRDPFVAEEPEEWDAVLQAFQNARVGFDADQGLVFGPGLGIARDLLRGNFGTFSIESDPARGTCMTLTVPTWNPRHLVERFLSAQPRQAATPIGLFEVSFEADPHQTADPFPVIDDFIQHAQAETGLILPKKPNAWMWLLIGDQTQQRQTVESIQRRWEKVCLEAPVSTLPKLAIRQVICWSGAQSTESIASSFDSISRIGNADDNHRPRLLLARDDHDSLASLVDRLESFGYDVVTALDTSKCIETAIQARPDAILMDSELPNAEGCSLYDDLQNRGETMHLPVVLLADGIRDQQRALDHGARHVMRKPFEPTQLRSTLEKVLTPG